MEEKDKKNLVETTHVPNALRSHTFKRLIRQLKESRKEVAQMKREAISERTKMTELMEGYNDTLDLEKFAGRRVQPFIGSSKTSTVRTSFYRLRTGS
jgi:hypothetical protein